MCDSATHLFARQVTTQSTGHDDRDRFLASIDLILAGVDIVR